MPMAHPVILLQFGASLGKQLSRPYLEKKPFIKTRASGGAQGIGPEFKLQYRKKRKKKISLIDM
jgi:hypothetical protein